MKTTPEWLESHKRSILFMIGIFAAGGFFASFRLPVALFPHVSFPRVVVSLNAGDRPADRMAIEVTRPVEEAVRAVPGVRTVRSNTTRGAADISVNFDWGEDMVSAMLQVESAINQTIPALPAGTSFEVRRMDPTVFPVLAYSLTSKSLTPVELRDTALYKLRPILSTVTGVAKIGIQGGDTAEYQVVVMPDRLMAQGLTLQDVAKALSASNVVQAVGRVEEHCKLYLTISDTRIRNIKQIENTVLKSDQNGLVRVEDVATVSQRVAPKWTRVTANGQDAVIFQVFQQPGGNTVQIAKDIKTKLAVFKAHLPPGVHVANWYDQSELVKAAATSVRDAVLIGVGFAALILVIFLRNLKMTFIALVMVPVALLSTILILMLLEMRFNIMTLGGLAAAVGLIIDDMIVMEEHIIRVLGKRGAVKKEAFNKAVREMTIPLAGSSLSTIIIFAPLAFLTGVTGSFFKALSITMAVSLVFSFFIAWLGVPVMANLILSQKDSREERLGRFTLTVFQLYDRMLEPVIRKPILLLPGVLMLGICGWFSFQCIGSGFMPHMDEGGFILDYVASPGTSAMETDRLLRQVENILMETPEVETYSRRTGLSLGGHITEANEGDFFIRLKPNRKRHIEEIMSDVRQRVEHLVPGLEIEMAQLMEDLIGDLTAVPQPVEIKLFSDDEHKLLHLAPVIAKKISKIPGVVDIKDGIVLAGDALTIHIDRDRAALEGIDPELVTQVLKNSIEGTVTTFVQEGIKMVGVRRWLPEEMRSRENALKNLLIRAPDGHFFPLRRIATIEPVSGQPQIIREDLKRMIPVTARISGRDMGSVIKDIRNELDKKGLIPEEMYYELGGLYQQQQIAFKGLIVVFVGAVLLIFTLLLFLYENFRTAASVLFNTMLSLFAVLSGLYITGMEINISSMMGMTMVVGIVTETAIFYVSELNFLIIEGLSPDKALVQAGKNRMRPIAMTTFAAIFALLPLALGIGKGSAMLTPLAIAIISGLAVQIFLVLLVLPALLSLPLRKRL